MLAGSLDLFQTRAADKNVAVQIYSGEYEVDVSESEVDATVAVKRSLVNLYRKREFACAFN